MARYLMLFLVVLMVPACAHKRPSEVCQENDYWKQFDSFQGCVQTVTYEQQVENERRARIAAAFNSASQGFQQSQQQQNSQWQPIQQRQPTNYQCSTYGNQTYCNGY